MPSLQLDLPVTRRVLEAVLAVLVILSTVVVIVEPAGPFETALGYVWEPATVLVPGLLALSVLAGVLAHGTRIGSALVGSGDRTRPGDTALTRILASFALGALAAYTLWWVVGSLYVVYLGETGGVLLGPVLALLIGSALGTLVLIRTLFHLFPENPTSRLRGPSVE